MNLRLAIGAVLRTLRSKEKRTRESLAEASSHTYLARLEHGKSGITVEKLELISETFGISPLTFLTLALATSKGETIDSLLRQTRTELDEFEADGGLDTITNQVKDGKLVTRLPGRQIDSQRLENVLKCKAQGMTQKMTAESLGISKQTVNKLWTRGKE
ncbi:MULTISPECIES: helix-turn-helix domain-containing protein [Pseudomonas syringae group]|uniref:Cro/CI family transcriptional regulator n=1 Tax=Pseudomonas syringae pv. coriandricola TaxID=264453 RepID=A0A0N8QX51_9PSED|nr:MULTISPECIES: helix-turn-helix domain-containing protein [Pseudomonas syringae group]KPW71814.1 Cro/CI family transcriptional regulator [Pseudomonas syringae pv. coriandricola]RMN12720.1 Cro/CI family transcriptional regulator [Pseudomonas syringae pv. coriandricola]